MIFPTLISLGLMGIVCSSFTCRKDCKAVTRHHQQYYKLVPDLQNSSVAPWDLIDSVEKGREPMSINHAKCRDCTVTDMIAKPIYLQIQVYKMTYNGTWCMCPYNLAVGCTCVKKTPALQEQS